MYENASAASDSRVPSESFPSASSSSCSTASYISGRVTTAENAKFFAAARIIVGPPMSMFSITSCSVAPRRAAVRSNG